MSLKALGLVFVSSPHTDAFRSRTGVQLFWNVGTAMVALNFQTGGVQATLRGSGACTSAWDLTVSEFCHTSVFADRAF